MGGGLVFCGEEFVGMVVVGCGNGVVFCVGLELF